MRWPAVCASLAGFLALLASMMPGPAFAQDLAPPQRPLCHDYRELVAQLGARYEEQPVSLGVQANGELLQVFSSARSRTWTILSISPSGTGCIIAAGRSWENMDVAKAEPEI